MGGSGIDQLGQPISVSTDSDGTLYVADSDNGRVQVVPLSDQTSLGEIVLPALSSQDEDCLREGIVSAFRDQAGFGFIVSDGKQYFAHHSDIVQEVLHGYPKLCKGDSVQFMARS